MNELETRREYLPDNPKELAPFVAVGTAFVNAARQTLKSGKLTREQYDSLLEKGQQQGEIILDAKAEIGRISKAAPKASGNRYTVESPRTGLSKAHVLDELDISKQQASRYESIATHPEAMEKAKAIAKKNGDIVTESLVLQIVKEQERETKRAEIIQNLEDVSAQEAKAAEGKYDVIVIDPPWPMQKIEREVAPNQMLFDYPTMSEDELAGLEIPAADNCHVFLWTTHKFIRMAMRLLDRWGMKYICTFVWHKNGGFQPFGLPQYNCEFCLYAHYGAPVFIDTKAFNTCFSANRTAHSEKPEEFYDTLRRVTAGRRLDMFNRRKIDGFDAWGNES